MTKTILILMLGMIFLVRVLPNVRAISDWENPWCYIEDSTLSLLISNLGDHTGLEKGDLNSDSKIDDRDLSLLLSHWHQKDPFNLCCNESICPSNNNFGD